MSGRGNVRKAVVAVITICLLAIAVFSGLKLYHMISEYRSNQQAYEVISEETTEDDDSLKVDFDELRKINPYVVGWIRYKCANIDYPIVRGEITANICTRDLTAHTATSAHCLWMLQLRLRSSSSTLLSTDTICMMAQCSAVLRNSEILSSAGSIPGWNWQLCQVIIILRYGHFSISRRTARCSPIMYLLKMMGMHISNGSRKMLNTRRTQISRRMIGSLYSAPAHMSTTEQDIL